MEIKKIIFDLLAIGKYHDWYLKYQERKDDECVVEDIELKDEIIEITLKNGKKYNLIIKEV